MRADYRRRASRQGEGSDVCRHLIPRIWDKGRGTVASQVGLALLRPCDSVVSSFVRVVGASLICFTSENQVAVLLEHGAVAAAIGLSSAGWARRVAPPSS